MFSSDELRTTVQQALNQPDVDLLGKRGAFLLVIDQQGARAVTAAKVGEVWTISGVADHPWHGDLTVGAHLKAAW